MPAFWADADRIEPDREDHRVGEQHPALWQVLGELDREHRADGVGRIPQAGAEAHRLNRHVQLLGDDGDERIDRGGQREIGDQCQRDHGGHGEVAPGEGALTH